MPGFYSKASAPLAHSVSTNRNSLLHSMTNQKTVALWQIRTFVFKGMCLNRREHIMAALDSKSTCRRIQNLCRLQCYRGASCCCCCAISGESDLLEFGVLKLDYAFCRLVDRKHSERQPTCNMSRFVDLLHACAWFICQNAQQWVAVYTDDVCKVDLRHVPVRLCMMCNVTTQFAPRLNNMTCMCNPTLHA